MRFRNIGTIAGWASATMGLTLAAFLPTSIQAVDPTGSTVVGQIATPTLTVSGCTLSVSLADSGATQAPTTRPAALKPGDVPNMVLTINNPTDSAQTIPWTVDVGEMTVPSRLSRVPMRSRSIWQDHGSMQLAAHETKTVQLEPKKSISANASGFVMLTSGEQSINALSMATPIAPARTTFGVQPASVVQN
jgi:hypothetical protein